jgi:hypothetical protein
VPVAIRETAVVDVEGFSGQSCQGVGVYRFLRGANREIRGAVRVSGSRASSVIVVRQVLQGETRPEKGTGRDTPSPGTQRIYCTVSR